MIEKLIKKSVNQLSAYEPVEQGEGIRLDSNENTLVPYLLNQKIAAALLKLNVNRYPDPNSSELIKLVAAKNRVGLDEAIIGSGSDQLIGMILNAFINEGDRIVTQAPTFSMYKISNQIMGGETVEVDMGSSFSFDYYSFIKVVKQVQPKVVFLTNPNNPTGGIIPREQIIKIIEHSNGIVVVDEAYYEFYGTTAADLIHYYPNLIVLRTLSKAYGLAGARIGYAIASKQLISTLKKVKPPYNISSLDQTAAKICLENQELFNGAINEIIEQRKSLMDGLNEIPEVESFESYGNFILLRVDSAEKLYEYLKDRRIFVRYYEGEGLLKNCIRVTVGTATENQGFMEVVRRYFGLQKEAPLKMAR
ncbi:histidinol-phosphate transaminase [Alkaliphilus peptidifermentans]|uniref:Histidinol-phosphate aminotransferase n=1 Tax=Alkaliphilus peptidifermentans DSM 18978 TaxID=1120976 RepID=A0A1G5AD69_9FIRM|nr:histidinol-phosphate transaminase [Alkaliphilus peptidifermentans]SCX75819.1 histidinol-phosphate aminotransferase [Alkaliphilus peptidifermentans DSM 18978]